MIKGDTWMSIRNDYLKGIPINEIARKYSIDRKTARKYAKTDKKTAYTYKKPRHKILEDYADFINEKLKEAPYSATRIKELLEEHYNIKISYTPVQKYVKNVKKDFNKSVTVRFETLPGEQGQVDWGFFENYKVIDEFGIERKLYCFLMILGYSRMRYIEFVTDMTTETLIKCHINAFHYFKGYPNEILYDNMKQVVIKRMLKQSDSTLNKTFEDFAGFYKFKPILCRPYRGQTKGKVERTVRYVRENFMIGIKYKNLVDLNKQALLWCEKINSKTHMGTNEIPKHRLIEEHLNKLEREYFIETNSIRKVEKDCLFSFRGNRYSVPSDYVKRNVIVACFDNIVVAYCDGKTIATHPLSNGSNRTIISPSHYNKLIRYQNNDFTPKNTLLDSGVDYYENLNKIDLRRYDV